MYTYTESIHISLKTTHLVEPQISAWRILQREAFAQPESYGLVESTGNKFVAWPAGFELSRRFQAIAIALVNLTLLVT